MSKRRLTILWITTAIVAALLLGATFNVFQKSQEVQEAGFTGYVIGVNSAIYLRSLPSNAGSIVTILELGMPVHVSDSARQGNVDWYLVETATSEGWIPAERISTNPLEDEA
jgi:hypothetical protein